MDTTQHRDVFTTMARGFHVARASAVLPATTTYSLFTISTGRVLVTLLMGEVTVVNTATATNAKILINPTTGTSGEIAADLAIASLEAGTIYLVEGDGSALVAVSAGGSYFAAGTPAPFVAPAGTLDLETSATNATGAAKWDIWYFPLDAGASVASA